MKDRMLNDERREGLGATWDHCITKSAISCKSGLETYQGQKDSPGSQNDPSESSRDWTRWELVIRTEGVQNFGLRVVCNIQRVFWSWL